MGIAAGMKDIVQGIVSSHEDRMKRIGEIREESQSRIMGFEASHEEMSQELKKGLAQGEAERKQTSAKIKTDLVQGVTNLKSEVNGMRNGFQTSHKEMSKELSKDLAQGEAERKQTSAKIKTDLVQGVTARKSDVKGILNDFQRSHKQMGAQLRKDLAQGETERKQTSAKLKNKVADYYRGIKSEVAGMRQETLDDLREARTAWQGLASTMPAKGSETEIPQKAEILVEETIDLKAKILMGVSEHPEGITLAEIADSLGVVPVVLGRTSKSLLDEGKIRKEDKLYFPVSAE